jgi:carbonic anhydrase/acetyltransferase-like protein (isoleucine patch superfamily)
MMRKNPAGESPEVDKGSYVDCAATVIGKVAIGKNVFIAPGAIIRADEPGTSIVIEDNCNIQDRVIIHAIGSSSVIVGKNSSLSHGCIIHGPCTIGEGCFVGFGSVVFDSSLGDGVFVKFMATVSGVTVSKGCIISDGAVVNTALKARRLAVAPKESREFSQRVLAANINLLKGYKKGT